MWVTVNMIFPALRITWALKLILFYNQHQIKNVHLIMFGKIVNLRFHKISRSLS